MKKILLLVAILCSLSFTLFSLEKSGIKEFDNLDLSKGKVTYYYDKDLEIVEDQSVATYYRKVFTKKDNLYLVVDFYNQSNMPQIIFTTKDPDDDSTRNGKMVSYDTMGNIEDIVDMKNGMYHGKKTEYSFGKVTFITEYSDDLANGTYSEYSNGRKYLQRKYQNGIADSDVILYNSDGTESVREVYSQDEKLLSVKNINYSRQKTGIPEYDNLDIKQNKILIYTNSDSQIVSNSSDDVFSYRKILGEENGLYLAVDFFMYSDNIVVISKVRKPKDAFGLTNEGYVFTFHKNGCLAAKSFYKDGKLDGETILYNRFGNPETINTYKNGKLINIKNLNTK